MILLEFISYHVTIFLQEFGFFKSFALFGKIMNVYYCTTAEY